MPELAILIPGIVLLTFLLGLPLLLKPDSLVPDLISLAILSVAVLAFIWGTETYWVVFPVLAVVAFVAWLDRGGPARAGAGDRTETRFRLWRAANRLQLALTVGALALFVSRTGMAAVTFVVAWMLVAMVASAGFRFSFARSCRRDGDALASGPLAP